MDNQNFTTAIVVDQTPLEVFNAVNNPKAWWSDGIEGNTDHLDDEWTYHHGDNHRTKLKVVELIPGKKVVWLVEENYFNPDFEVGCKICPKGRRNEVCRG